MRPTSHLDCLIVGYNDIDLAWVDEELQPLQEVSGGFRHFCTNSVHYKGRRRHYTDLLNHVLSEVTGSSSQIHIAETPSLACCVIKSYLERHDLQTEIVNFFNRDKHRLASLLALSPKAVVITTTMYTQSRPVKEISEFVREHNTDTTIIVGGPHIFNLCSDYDEDARDYLLQEMGADVYVFDSQGELTLSRLLHELRREKPDLTQIPNLIWTDDGEHFLTNSREIENNDLDENVVDWSRFDPDYIAPTAWMRTARSCAFSCAFCRYPALGGALSLNSIETLEQQFHQLQSLGVRFIYFIDDTFNVPLPRFKELCRMMIRNRFDFRWASYFRCANADDETFDLIREAGCEAVFAGIESGDQQILKNMNKGATIERYKYGIRSLMEREIMVHASFIIGFPGETAASALNTLEFIEETAPTYYSVETYFHDPKVPVQARAAEFDLTGSGYSWHHASMNWRQASDLVEKILREVSGSLFLPLYGADMWSIPHFLSRGITRDQLTGFFQVARQMVVKNFDQSTPNYGAEEKRLHSLFAS